ncbi:MAG: DUF2490 domain-containing protein [Cyclobacteriaceae bacterium]
MRSKFQEKGWKVNGKILDDLYFLQDIANRSEGLQTDLSFDQFEYSLTTAKSISPFLNLAFGYLYGDVSPFSEGSNNEHRLVQQITISQLFTRTRLSEQIRVEERFFGRGYRTRLRIKFALEVPLEGIKLDPGEWYLVSSNETLLDLRPRMQRNAFYTENRMQVSFGKFASNRNKTEYGIGYHLARINQNGLVENYIYFRTGFYISR